jgi:hypothetical protein
VNIIEYNTAHLIMMRMLLCIYPEPLPKLRHWKRYKCNDINLHEKNQLFGASAVHLPAA